MPNTHICIDSSVFIRGVLKQHDIILKIIEQIGDEFALSIPRIVASEVTRNLRTTEEAAFFYQIFYPSSSQQNHSDFAQIIDSPIPANLVQKYIALGLPAKADAFIGAFAEWQNVDYLLSDNRHFLRELKTTAFQVANPEEFVAQL